MLHRKLDDQLVAISQPAHAWISGQLARSWGNLDLGLEPVDAELHIAAEQHDIAWLEWESAPTLNPSTGLPYTFMELPTIEHLNVWGRARPWALSYGRLPALLISMHGTHLYDRFHDYEQDTDGEVRRAQAFLKSEKAFQERVISELIKERDISQDQIIHKRRLLSLWDAISLAICMGIDAPRRFDAISVQERDITLEVLRSRSDMDAFIVHPWPFSGDEVVLHCEGKALDRTFDDESDMRAALVDAPSRSIGMRLIPR